MSKLLKQSMPPPGRSAQSREAIQTRPNPLGSLDQKRQESVLPQAVIKNLVGK
ncbi:MAG: hypothetical protein HYT15_00825 [Candidatus Magasanikbacteria bacterium]|nr:hypothetical protein [Candidatus Magasanikbacteria bacterium]